jgi:hypothetical protein
VGGPATSTVHAKAASSDGDNAELDGNEQASENVGGGVEPNGDDYVIHVACHARTYSVTVDYPGTFQDDYTTGTDGVRVRVPASALEISHDQAEFRRATRTKQDTSREAGHTVAALLRAEAWPSSATFSAFP